MCTYEGVVEHGAELNARGATARELKRAVRSAELEVIGAARGFVGLGGSPIGVAYTREKLTKLDEAERALFAFEESTSV